MFVCVRVCVCVCVCAQAGAKLDVRNSRGLTPLGEAVVWNNAGAVAVLLDTKALATVTIKG